MSPATRAISTPKLRPRIHPWLTGPRPAAPVLPRDEVPPPDEREPSPFAAVDEDRNPATIPVEESRTVRRRRAAVAVVDVGALGCVSGRALGGDGMP